jgi:hypothetical protein
LSRDTTFLICGISNFEVLKLKNSVKGQMNSVWVVQKLIFATRSKPNQSPKHMSTFANVVEDSLNFSFTIQGFPRLVQNFGEKSLSKCVDELVFFLSSRSRAPANAHTRWPWPPRACSLASALRPPFEVLRAPPGCGWGGLPHARPPAGPPLSAGRRVWQAPAPCAPLSEPLSTAGTNAEAPSTPCPALEPWPRRGGRCAYKRGRCSFRE